MSQDGIPVEIRAEGEAVELGDQVGTIKSADVVWLDDVLWEEIDGPEDAESGDATAKIRVLFDVKDADDYETRAEWWLNPRNGSFGAGPNTGLGEFLRRIGNVESFEGQKGEQLMLDEIFEVGSQWRFELVENSESGGYPEINERTLAGHSLDEDNDQPEWGETLSPVDGDGSSSDTTTDTTPSAEGDSSDQEAPDDPKGKIYEIVAGADDPDESAVLQEIAQLGGDLVPVFKEMKESGELEITDDGEVTI